MTLNQNETCTLAMRYKQILLGLILFVLLGGFLQITSKFHFFYIEQLQLFQFSGDYLTDKISNPGGLSLIIGEFLTQFFITPYAGPFIIAAILTSIGLTMRAIIRQINPDDRSHCQSDRRKYSCDNKRPCIRGNKELCQEFPDNQR